jgi:bla regulator protein BlaR1
MIPTYSSTVWAAIGPTLANHLWQSTLFAAFVGVLALLLRREQARVRYWLWLAASMKFLVPFSLLVSAGSHLGWATAPPASASPLSVVVQQVSQTFVPGGRSFGSSAAASPTLLSTGGVFPALLLAAWFCGCMAILLSWCVKWRRLITPIRAATRLREGPEVEALIRL